MFYQLKRDIENLNKKGYLNNVVKKLPDNPPTINEVATSSQQGDPEGDQLDYVVYTNSRGPAIEGILLARSMPR